MSERVIVLVLTICDPKVAIVLFFLFFYEGSSIASITADDRAAVLCVFSSYPVTLFCFASIFFPFCIRFIQILIEIFT